MALQRGRGEKGPLVGEEVEKGRGGQGPDISLENRGQLISTAQKTIGDLRGRKGKRVLSS